MAHVLPTHQGRAAEGILAECLVREGHVIPNNSHFDTTRANIEYRRGIALNLPCAEAFDTEHIAPFKGNMDVDALRRCIAEHGRDAIPFAMMTVTNNTGGGQPVSLGNLRAYADLLHRHGKPLLLDACRFAENAMFVKLREPGQQDRTVKAIAQEMFALADGCTMSAKKDGLVNIGGFLALRSDEWLEALRNVTILTEGFPTYGGLAGRDLEAMAVGLEEVVDEAYLRYRLRTAEYLGEKLEAAGVGFVRPTGGHAVYLDARTVLPDLPVSQYPAWALCNALYLQGGIRGVEIGSVMFGKRGEDGAERYHAMELVRLAFPRRMYTQSHFDFAAEVVAEVKADAASVRGVRIVKQAPFLRHFTCECEWA
jgi:tryptophanase